jgi:hypothetical protein
MCGLWHVRTGGIVTSIKAKKEIKMEQRFTQTAIASQVVDHACKIMPTTVVEVAFKREYAIYHVTVVGGPEPIFTVKVSNVENSVLLFKGALTEDDVMSSRKGFVGAYAMEGEMKVLDLDEKHRQDFAAAIAAGHLH